MKIQNNTFPNELEIEDFKNWTFELSDFQKWSIYGLKNNKNIIITAHTGSGKTLPAEWTFIHFIMKEKKKIIYTAPIKALCNEKFNKFSIKYPEVNFGIHTGDTQFNPTADCIIMTTEVLRNNLYKKFLLDENPELKKTITLDFELNFDEFAVVIMDELHYINTRERGPVWEESIMNLPNNIRLLGLSATLDKPEKIGEWVENVNNAETWICPNYRRVVPLYHYSWLTCQPSIIKKLTKNVQKDFNIVYEKPVLIKDKHKDFDEKKFINIQKILNYINKNRCWVDQHFVVERLLYYLKNNKELPALFFIFSKKQCQKFAEKISINLFEEDSMIPSIIKKECDKLLRRLDNYDELICLPEYHTMIKLLEKGIAVHHSGILLQFKEVIEILFDKGYIKLLIATGTMVIGINMPVKTVIVHSLSKYSDGTFKYLLPSEYTQMAGRAGRRGIDIQGKVYHLNNIFDINDNNPTCNTYKHLLSGTPEILKSKFSIHFNLILRLIPNCNTIEKMCSFLNKSMIKYEIIGERNYVAEQINSLKENYEKSLKSVQYLKTNSETLNKYHDLINLYNNSTNKKKKKKLEREISFIQADNKFIVDDYKKKIIPDKIKLEISKLEKQLINIENYIKDEINVYVKILNNKNFITLDKDIKEIKLTEKGIIASNINEIHPLCMSEIIFNKLLDDHNECEIIAILSLFTNVRVSKDELKTHNINNTNLNDKVKSTIKKINDIYYNYYDIETHNQTSFKENYDIHYDLCDIMYMWSKQLTGNGCLKLCEKVKTQKNIFIGDFVKAIFKINNLVLELQKICEVNNNLHLLTKLKNIPQYLLKSIALNQSIYLKTL